jgi:hypothetical protein
MSLDSFPSPYIVGPPISEPSNFFGRRRQIKQFFNMLRGATLLPLCVLGLRRSGKTSFLLHIANPEVSAPAIHDDSRSTIVAYVNLQAGVSTPSEFYLAVAEAIARCIPSDPPFQLPGTLSEFRSFYKWLESIITSPGRFGGHAHEQTALEVQASASPVKLREKLERHFDREELRTLCSDLEVDYDDLPGEGRAAKVRELVGYHERRGQLDELVKRCSELRPNVFWNDRPAPGYSGTLGRQAQWLRVVVLLDEFERLTKPPEFTSSFFGGLRALASAPWAGHFTWVTASYLDLYALGRKQIDTDKTSPFFNIFHPTPIVLGAMEPEETECLVSQPAKSYGVDLSQQEIETIQNFAGPLPYSLQAVAEQWFFARKANVPAAQCREKVLEQLDHPKIQIHKQLDYYWEHLEEKERNYLRLAVLGKLMCGTNSDVVQKLLNFGLLAQEGNNLQVAGELFGRWIEKNYSQRSHLMDTSAVAPFVPVIVEATKFVFNEASKWIDDIRKKAPNKVPSPQPPLALPITQDQFSKKQADLQAMATMMNSLAAETRANEIQGLVEQIQIHRKNLTNLEIRSAKYGIDVPISAINQIDDESESIVTKTARLVELLRRVYQKEA